MLVTQQEEWIPMSEAVTRFRTSQAKLAKLVQQKKVRQQRDARDERIKLVNVADLRQVYGDK